LQQIEQLGVRRGRLLLERDDRIRRFVGLGADRLKRRASSGIPIARALQPLVGGLQLVDGASVSHDIKSIATDCAPRPFQRVSIGARRRGKELVKNLLGTGDSRGASLDISLCLFHEIRERLLGLFHTGDIDELGDRLVSVGCGSGDDLEELGPSQHGHRGFRAGGIQETTPLSTDAEYAVSFALSSTVPRVPVLPAAECQYFFAFPRPLSSSEPIVPELRSSSASQSVVLPVPFSP
jgi:hypothetical protein